MLASVFRDQFVFGTLQCDIQDDPSLVERVGKVMQEAGYWQGRRSHPSKHSVAPSGGSREADSPECQA
jgi:hypothetical protein